MSQHSRAPIVGSIAIAVLFAAHPALAGPPLLCFPFDIGGAKSLPMGTTGWRTTDPTYDTARLVDDTVRLLTPTTPVIVRMETLRRATIYATANPTIANRLLITLEQRAGAPIPDAAQAVFDFGYLVETYRQAKWMGSIPKAVDSIDGYELVIKAYRLQRDPAMEFAAAVITEDATRRGKAVHAEHLTHVMQSAKADALLEANLAAHFADRAAR
jgi:hypothetical protein